MHLRTTSKVRPVNAKCYTRVSPDASKGERKHKTWNWWQSLQIPTDHNTALRFMKFRLKTNEGSLLPWPIEGKCSTLTINVPWMLAQSYAVELHYSTVQSKRCDKVPTSLYQTKKSFLAVHHPIFPFYFNFSPCKMFTCRSKRFFWAFFLECASQKLGSSFQFPNFRDIQVIAQWKRMKVQHLAWNPEEVDCQDLQFNPLTLRGFPPPPHPLKYTGLCYMRPFA